MMRDLHEMQRELHLWMASADKVAIAVFFRNNPGVVDTLDNLAQRLAIPRETLRSVLEDHIRLGVVRERTISGQTVYMLDRRRRAELEGHVARLAAGAIE